MKDFAISAYSQPSHLRPPRVEGGVAKSKESPAPPQDTLAHEVPASPLSRSLSRFGKAVKSLVALDTAVGNELGQATTPGEAAMRIKRLFSQKVADGGSHVGLDPVRLVQMQKQLYQATSSRRNAEGKIVGPPRYLENMFAGGPPSALGKAIPGGPLQSDWFADLRQGAQSRGMKAVLTAAISFCREQEISDHLSGSLARWATRTQSEGSVREGTTTFVNEQLKSMYPSGDELPSELRSYGRLVDMKSYCSDLSPWLQTERPQVHKVVENAVDRLTPRWLSDSTGGLSVAHRSDPLRIGRVYDDLGVFAKDDPTSFADSVVALERTILAEEQTVWMKLLREGSPEQRKSLVQDLARSWAELTSSPPSDGPVVEKFRDSDRTVQKGSYNRAEELGSVVEHTLRALSGEERETFRQSLVEEMTARKDSLLAQDAKVREIFQQSGGSLSDYGGVNIEALLREQSSDASTFEAMSSLRLASAGEDSLPLVKFPGQVSLSDSDRGVVRQHLAAVELLASQKERFAPRNADQLLSRPDLSDRPFILGPYADVGAISPEMVEALPKPKSGLLLGSGQGLEAQPVSIVLEGGGGKGFSFASNLSNLFETLEAAPSRFKVDEFCGTSAGAITASLLAAGYTPKELGEIMESLPFSEFFSDHHQLTTGDDPKVGGVQRAGLFTTRAMEQKIEQLLQDKLGIHDRPVTFDDLPFKLKVPATLLSTNASPELLEMLDYSPETGRVLFSHETSPNMSVAAAAAASGSFPTAFHPPTMEISRPVKDADGKVTVEHSWLQCTDGGVVDNFPIGLAGEAGEEKQAVVLPSHYSDGLEDGASLATLDFNAIRARELQGVHQQFYEQHGPALGQFLATTDRSTRTVFGINLCTPEEQSNPVVVGESKTHTSNLHKMAQRSGLQLSSSEEGAKIIADNTLKGSGQRLATSFIQTVTEDAALNLDNPTGLPNRPVEDLRELVNWITRTAGRAAAHQDARRFESP